MTITALIDPDPAINGKARGIILAD